MRIFWNADERRLRAFWRLLVQLALLGAIALLPLITAVEWLADLHRQGAFLPGLGKAMFDKAMDFIAGPGFTILLILSVIVAARFVDRRNWRDLGLRLDRAWRSDFVFGLLLGAALVALVFAAENYHGWVEVSPRPTPGIAGVPVVLLWAFVGLKAICVGTSEEIVSRGYQLKNIAEGLNGVLRLSPVGAAVVAALITSVVFAALHFTTGNFDGRSLLGLTVNGLLLALPVLLTGRLGMSIGLHMAWNFTEGGIFGYAVSGDVENISILTATVTGPADWTGGAYGPEAGYLGWLAMLAGAIVIVARVRLTTGRAKVLPSIAEYRARASAESA